MQIVKKEFYGRELSLETGRMAKQAAGSVVVRYGDTMVLVTATINDEPKPDTDFFPLTVDFQEKLYAAGKIPGGFFKREAKPSTKATLTARLIDRPIRPLFPEGVRNPIHVVATTLSYDGKNLPDTLGIIGASVALSISKIPFSGPVAAVSVGLIDGKFVFNPSPEELENSQLELIVAGTKDAINMVEAGAKEISEDKMLEALELAHKEIKKLIDFQEELIKKVAVPKMEIPLDKVDPALEKELEKLAAADLRKAFAVDGKLAKYAAIDAVKKKLHETMLAKLGEEEFAKKESHINRVFENLEYNEMRALVLDHKKRVDGRGLEEIRLLTSEVGTLPCVHGSALFTRGETQALAAVTLGTKQDEQTIDGLDETYKKRFYLHYNFPPFSVGETGRLGATGRRELGHGALAERALTAIMPPEEKFPYTVRIVSEILESNGSSSMATVCCGTLALMDAGVPIKSPVAGIAMGLIADGKKYAVLTDIQGMEDHLGDMDFKVTGTREGITALQMDIKIQGIARDILKDSLRDAYKARIKLLDHMQGTIKATRPELSKYAPRIETIQINTEKIGLIIGPGGKTIRGMVDEFGVTIDINDDGIVTIASTNGEAMQAAKDRILSMVEEPEVGRVYNGKVTRIMDFGAFVEILPDKEGLVHISQISDQRVNKVSDVLKVGQAVKVQVREIDELNRVNLTMKGVK
jgi:polyribonucleotide nucleotidyltransferase